jgi:pyruvate formate lyase activating enzyme
MINGVMKMSLVDYPKLPAYVIFMGGCNMRCPFCHNKSIVDKETETFVESVVLEDLKKRKGFINAVVITGGEPTIHGDKLIKLISKIKKMGFVIKLDTNGTNPDLLEKIISKEIVDYIAMDIKNVFSKYEETCGVKVDIEKIKRSISIIEDSGVEYEFRTTVNKDMHSEKAISTIIGYVKDKKRLLIQPYKYSSEQIRDVKYTEYTDEDLLKIQKKHNIDVRV